MFRNNLLPPFSELKEAAGSTHMSKRVHDVTPQKTVTWIIAVSMHIRFAGFKANLVVTADDDKKFPNVIIQAVAYN
jgi:hypothetical protein